MNIFCVESVWEAKSKQTIKPILNLLKNDYGIKYRLFRYKNLTEFAEFCSNVLPEDDIIYIASHGEPNVIKVFSDSSDVMTLDKLTELLSGKSNGKVVHIGSCGTLNVHHDHFMKIFERLQCRILSGYIYDINWVESASMDLLYLDTLVAENIKTDEDLKRFLDAYGCLIDKTGFAIKVK